MESENYKYKIIWFLTILLVVIPPLKISAQDQAFFSQHLNNQMVYNPAFAGDRKIPGFSLLSRQQWLSWEGSPSSNFLMAHTKLKNKNVGLGVTLSYDRMGPVQHTGFSGAYAYTLKLSETSSIMMGLQGELRVHQIRLTQLQLIDQGDQLFSEDPGLRLQPNVGFGINYILDNYSINLAVPRLLNAKLSPYNGETSRWSKTSQIIYLGTNARYVINEDIEVIPSILMAISRGNSLFMEFAGTGYYRDRFGLGTFYRINKTWGVMLRYNHQEQFIFGYSFDVSFNVTRYNAGTHELFLGYNLPFNKIKTVSPRRF